MHNKSESVVDQSYRLFYGKLFSSLISQFGADNMNEIEDAIQNAFLKSLKSWKPNHIPDNKENWLYIVARNDVLNQIKRKSKTTFPLQLAETELTEATNEDLRLQTVLFMAALTNISTQTKVVFILKNIFGLHVREISESTLLGQEAIYKTINRAKKSLQSAYRNKSVSELAGNATRSEVAIVEEVFYAVFNIGFDSFNEAIHSFVNEELCLEAIALVKLLVEKCAFDSTKNLLALLCFHIARIPAKIDNGKLISFFKQDKTKWNKNLMDLGYHYLRQPKHPDRFYIEALIISKYMTADSYPAEHWKEIVKLYEILIQLNHSPIVKLNLCYAFHKAKRTQEALAQLENIKNELPADHIYLALVKADILKASNPLESEQIVTEVLHKMDHSIRKAYLLENAFINDKL